MMVTDRRVTLQVFGLALLSGVLVIFLTVSLAITYATSRFDRSWARALGLVATLGVALTMFWPAFGVLQPLSPLEFTVDLMFVFGVVLSLVGGVRALATGRRGEVAAAAGATRLGMSDFAFTPEMVSIAEGGTLLVTNDDLFAHDVTIDALGVYVHVVPGGEALIDLADAPPGPTRSTVRCTPAARTAWSGRSRSAPDRQRQTTKEGAGRPAPSSRIAVGRSPRPYVNEVSDPCARRGRGARSRPRRRSCCCPPRRSPGT